MLVTLFLFCNKCNNTWNAGPILESKGMGVIFQKTGKIFENFSKNVQNLKKIEKGKMMHAIITHNKQLE